MRNQIIKIFILPLLLIFGFLLFPTSVFAEDFPALPDYVKAPYWNSNQGSVYEGWYSEVVVWKSSINNRFYSCKVKEGSVGFLKYGYQSGAKLIPQLSLSVYTVDGVQYVAGCLDVYHYYNNEWTKSSIQTGDYYIYLPNNASVGVNMWTEVNMYYAENIGTNPYNFGSLYNNIGALYWDDLILEGNYSHGTAPAPAPETPAGYSYYIEYSSPPKIGTVLLVSRQKCFLPLSNPNSMLQPIECLAGPLQFIEYSVVDGQRFFANDTSHTWSVYTPDAPDDYCSALVSSNYTITDSSGNPLCKATINPRVEELVPPYTGVIDFDPEEYDWGTFDWFKEPVAFFVEIINDIVGWFYNLYGGFLNLIVPNPETFSWFTGSIRATANEKFGSIDLTSLSALQNISASTMSNITINWRGSNMTIINFDLLKDNIDTIRPVLIASVGLFIIIFNVNMVNKLLSDEEITTV